MLSWPQLQGSRISTILGSDPASQHKEGVRVCVGGRNGASWLSLLSPTMKTAVTPSFLQPSPTFLYLPSSLASPLTLPSSCLLSPPFLQPSITSYPSSLPVFLSLSPIWSSSFLPLPLLCSVPHFGASSRWNVAVFLNSKRAPKPCPQQVGGVSLLRSLGT